MVFWTCFVLSVDINTTATGRVGGKGNVSYVEGEYVIRGGGCVECP